MHKILLLDCIDENREFKVLVLDTNNIAHKSWKNVLQHTIQKCFTHCGFYEDQQTEVVSIPEGIVVVAADWTLAVDFRMQPNIH